MNISQCVSSPPCTPSYGDLDSFYLQSISDPLISTPTTAIQSMSIEGPPGYKWFMPVLVLHHSCLHWRVNSEVNLPMSRSLPRPRNVHLLHHWEILRDTNEVADLATTATQFSGHLVQHSSWIFAITYFKVRLQLKLHRSVECRLPGWTKNWDRMEIGFFRPSLRSFRLLLN